jgi:hypothetical protein
VRARGIQSLKKLVDINIQPGFRILGGVIYARWGCLMGKPRTAQEWEWSVGCMREVEEEIAKPFVKAGVEHPVEDRVNISSLSSPGTTKLDEWPDTS